MFYGKATVVTILGNRRERGLGAAAISGQSRFDTRDRRDREFLSEAAAAVPAVEAWQNDVPMWRSEFIVGGRTILIWRAAAAGTCSVS